MIELSPIVTTVAAPRVYVFRCLTAYGEPSPVWRAGQEPELVARRGGVLTIRIRRRLGAHMVSALARVRLRPPEVIATELVEGPFTDLRETVTLSAVEGGTLVEYRGDLSLGGRGLSHIAERLLTGPLHRREMRHEMKRWRAVIEAAARASGLADGA